MDAVDVAFTEAAVGAGISTVLILGTLALPRRKTTEVMAPPIVVFITGGALIYGTLDMPAYVIPTPSSTNMRRPISSKGEGRRFQYRYRDFGQSVRHLRRNDRHFYGFCGRLAVARPMWSRQSPAVDESDSGRKETPTHVEGDSSCGERSVNSFILLYGLAVPWGLWAGRSGWGDFCGRFHFVQVDLWTDRLKAAIAPTWVEIGLAIGVLLYGGVGFWAMQAGGTFLDYHVLDPNDPAHGLHLGLLLIEGGVGLTVACAMTVIFYAFAGRGGRT